MPGPAPRLAAALLALALAPASAGAEDAVVRSFDGTPIVLTFTPAPGLGDGERAPTILAGHGWGATRQSAGETSAFTRAGYNVLTWDARGFGQSGGEAQVDSPDFEARDARALIDWLAGRREAQLDGPKDPRVGMWGSSYGGGVQWVTAATDPRVDVIAPDIAWHSLVTSLNKDGAVKSGWAQALVGAGATTGLALGFFSPAGPQAGHLAPQIYQAYAEGLTAGRLSKESVDWFAARGPGALVENIRVPTLISQGTVDTLFTLDEAIRNFDVLQRNGVPVKMIWHCGGHGACLTASGGIQGPVAPAVAWFDRWLRGREHVDTGPGFEWQADDGAWRSSEAFPLARVATASGTASGSVALGGFDTGGSGTLIAATPAAGNTVDGAIEAPAVRDVVGAPFLRMTYKGTATPAETHLYAQIVDTSRNVVVGNQVTPIPVILDGAERTIERPLEPIAARTSGRPYRLQIVPSTNVYGPQRSAGAAQVMRAEVELPVTAPTGRPSVLRQEPDAGRRCPGRARPPLELVLPTRVDRPRGPRLDVLLCAESRLKGLRLVLTKRGRVLGSSRAVTFVGRARIALALRRKLRPGAYRMRARARTADGRRRALRLVVHVR